MIIVCWYYLQNYSASGQIGFIGSKRMKYFPVQLLVSTSCKHLPMKRLNKYSSLGILLPTAARGAYRNRRHLPPTLEKKTTSKIHTQEVTPREVEFVLPDAYPQYRYARRFFGKCWRPVLKTGRT